MAIYHFSMRNISRKSGSSSIASLSYILGEPVKDERLGQTSYQHKNIDRIMASNTLLPEGAPEEFHDPKKLFNSIEMYEKSSTARTAKRIIVALPNENSLNQNRELMDEFCRNLTAMGYACTYAIHYDEWDRNHHAHIIIPNRQINKNSGAWEKTKSKKEYVLDAEGNRVPVIDPATGEQKVDGRNRKQWLRKTVTAQPLDRKETLQNLRAEWARECNQFLDPDHQISEKSLADQGINRIPMIHEGPTARAIAKRTMTSERTAINLEIAEANEEISLLEQAIIAIAAILFDLIAKLEVMVNPSMREDKEALSAAKVFGIDTDFAYDENMEAIWSKDTGHSEIYDAVMGVKNMLKDRPELDVDDVLLSRDLDDAGIRTAKAVLKDVKQGIVEGKGDEEIVNRVQRSMQQIAMEAAIKKKKHKQKTARKSRDDDPSL